MYAFEIHFQHRSCLLDINFIIAIVFGCNKLYGTF